MNDKKGLTSSQEDYLKEIYIMVQQNTEVRVTDVARILGISKPSVNRAMNMLKEQGYIEHEHYGTIKMTEAGLAAGENIYETYRTVCRFLVEVLGVKESEAAEEAHLIEHTITKGTRKKMKKFLKKKK